MTKFDLQCMSLGLEDLILDNDIKKILSIYINDPIPEINPSYFIATVGCFKSPVQIIYNKIISIIRNNNMIIELLDIMPYIDDYLEIYF